MQLSVSDQRCASLPVSLGTEGLFACKSMSTVFLMALAVPCVCTYTKALFSSILPPQVLALPVSPPMAIATTRRINVSR